MQAIFSITKDKIEYWRETFSPLGLDKKSGNKKIRDFDVPILFGNRGHLDVEAD